LKIYSFPKNEHLKKQKLFDAVFKNAKSVLFYPILFKYNFSQKEDQFSRKSAFIVSKKKIRSAVDRNLVKRRMKEAYRTHKPIFESESKTLIICCIYVGKEIENYKLIEKAYKNFQNLEFKRKS
jgi:ribonuclease P protein component